MFNTFNVKSYGCQSNFYDGILIESILTKSGYEYTNNYLGADIIVLNTCHIREKATEKVFSEIGRIVNNKQTIGKKTFIVIAGCVSQAEGAEIMRRSRFVDIVVGPQDLHRIPVMIAEKVAGVRVKIADRISLDFSIDKKFDYLPEELRNQGSSSFLSIQEGCDKFCTFCVVPYTRGPEYSRDAIRIIEDATTMVERGSKEIILLGQNVNGYHGIGLDGKTWNLGRLIIEIAKIAELKRIRYTAPHPSDMHDDLYIAHRDEEKLMPFVNMPVQSGSDRILAKMNRSHTRKDYLEIIHRMKNDRKDMKFSSDIIVGFADETIDDFNHTLSIVDEVGYISAFSFKYSVRPGTVGENFKHTVSEDEKSRRLHILQDKIDSGQYEFNKSFEGKELEVLFNEANYGKNYIHGKTIYNQSVIIPLNDITKHAALQIKTVKVKAAFAKSLYCELA